MILEKYVTIKHIEFRKRLKESFVYENKRNTRR